jgi:hypothetical protein
VLTMPLAHRPLLRVEAGLAEAEERKARGEHLLVASGPCGLLHLLLPGLVPSASATVSPSTCEVPLRLAGWARRLLALLSPFTRAVLPLADGSSRPVGEPKDCALWASVSASRV